MKLPGFFRPLVSLLPAAFAAFGTMACGPFVELIPTPEFFALSRPEKPMADFEREENIRLWQAQTSEQIPAADIEQAVYCDGRAVFYARSLFDDLTTDNLFYRYLRTTSDREIADFLIAAKELEGLRANMRSPWYYPESHDSGLAPDGLDRILDRSRSHSDSRLADRYALQATRALFAAGRYGECIEFCDSAFADIDDSNLMKRMALRYAAGCRSRLGETLRADTMFALTGDVNSIARHDPAKLMSELNPGAPQFMEYVRAHASDRDFMRSMMPIARRLTDDRRVAHKGDWHFLMAYVDNKFIGNPARARSEIDLALQQSFSSAELRDLARAYRMKLDAAAGNADSLLDDLRWLETMTDAPGPDRGEWIRRCRNIIYEDWIPRLWPRGDYATAIMLCAYADSFTSDLYGTLSFQMMGSLTSERLATTRDLMDRHSPLFDFLRRKSPYGNDHFNELIATLALREENYPRAIAYLQKVSDSYLESMKINRDGYLGRDPFRPYRPRINDWQASPHSGRQAPDAKLKFARRMLDYKREMSSGRTTDDRAMARLMYAIGRRNSFEECWALTQYWRGDGRAAVGIFAPALDYWCDDDFSARNYGFLYDYLSAGGMEATEELYRREVNAALASFASPEAKARAHYLLGNLKTIVKHYGNTPTARHVKSSCDNWESWL